MFKSLLSFFVTTATLGTVVFAQPNSYEFELQLEQRLAQEFAKIDSELCKKILAGREAITESLDQAFSSFYLSMQHPTAEDAVIANIIQNEGLQIFDEEVFNSHVIPDSDRTKIVKSVIRQLTKKYEDTLIAQQRQKYTTTPLKLSPLLISLAAVTDYFTFIVMEEVVGSAHGAAGLGGLLPVAAVLSLANYGGWIGVRDLFIFSKFLVKTHIQGEPAKSAAQKILIASAFRKYDHSKLIENSDELIKFGQVIDGIQDIKILNELQAEANACSNPFVLDLLFQKLILSGDVDLVIDKLKFQNSAAKKLNDYFRSWIQHRPELKNTLNSMVLRGHNSKHDLEMGEFSAPYFFNEFINNVSEVTLIPSILMGLNSNCTQDGLLGVIRPELIDSIYINIFKTSLKRVTHTDANAVLLESIVSMLGSRKI